MTRQHLAARAVAGLGVAAALLVGLATPALAHGAGGADATNFLSVLSGVDGAPEGGLDGVTWRVLGGDALLEVDNTTAEELHVPGYGREPYLRIGPDGVFENRLSPATYLNDDRFAVTPVPPEADVDAEPEWVRLSTGSSHAWHDHRIHWMATVLPPQVTLNPQQDTFVQDVLVPFTVADAEYTLTGELRWVPAPPWWPWVLGAVVVMAAPVLLVLRRRGGDRGALLRTAAVVLGLLALLDAAHTVDDLLVVPATLAETLTFGLQAAAFAAIGLFGAWRAWQGKEGAATALCVGAAAIAIGFGLLHLGALTRSQVVSLLPDWVARGLTAANLLVVVPAGIAAWRSGDFRVDAPVAPLAVAEDAPSR